MILLGVPDQTPPAGVPIRVNSGEVSTTFWSAPAFATGLVFTVTLLIAEPEQPATVTEYVSVWVPTKAEEGVKTPEPLTPEPDQVPPDGVPLRLNAGSFEQTVWEGEAVTVGLAFTVNCTVELPEHSALEAKYVSVKVPMPAAEGLKLPELTPVPDQVPPAGVPWLSVIAGSVSQKVRAIPALTTGAAVTVTVVCALPAQAPETVYVKTLAPTRELLGVNTPEGLTPLPAQVPPDGLPDNVMGEAFEQTGW